MAKKKKMIPEYGTVTLKGVEYYRTRLEDADGKRFALYGRTREELYEKEERARREIAEKVYHRENPTVEEYCERWLLMQSALIRATTLADYSSKVKNYIVVPLGHKYMANVTADDVRLAVVPASQKSQSLYHSVQTLYKSIFRMAVESNIISESPVTINKQEPDSQPGMHLVAKAVRMRGARMTFASKDCYVRN